MNIEVRPIVEADGPDLFFVIDTQREYLGEWLSFVHTTKNIEDICAFIRAEVRSRTAYTFTILADGSPKGIAGLKDIDSVNKNAEIGYWLSKDLQGQGIMTGAVKSLLELGFSTLALKRIQIKAATANSKSRRIPERLGFTLEGIERAGELIMGDFIDLAVYSLLENEYRTLFTKTYKKSC